MQKNMTETEKNLSFEERELLGLLDSNERQSALERIQNGEPSAYVFGKKYFFKNYFHINRDCLIPRPDTERVVEHCLDALKGIDAPLIADLCSGCGIIGLTLLDEIKDARAHLYEISQGALDAARLNAKELDCIDRAQLFPCDLMKAADLTGNLYDLIVSNPPYLATSEIADYPDLDAEPYIAFDGGEGGEDFYVRFLSVFSKNLKENGCFIFEIGYAQRKAITDIASSFGYDCRVFRDYGGNDRVAVLTRRKNENK